MTEAPSPLAAWRWAFDPIPPGSLPADFVSARRCIAPAAGPVRLSVHMPRRAGRLWRSRLTVDGLGSMGFVAADPIECLWHLACAARFCQRALRLQLASDEAPSCAEGSPAAHARSWGLASRRSGVCDVVGPAPVSGGRWATTIMGRRGPLKRASGYDALDSLVWVAYALNGPVGLVAPLRSVRGGVVDRLFPVRRPPRAAGGLWCVERGHFIFRHRRVPVEFGIAPPTSEDGRAVCWAKVTRDRWGCFRGHDEASAFANALSAFGTVFDCGVWPPLPGAPNPRWRTLGALWCMVPVLHDPGAFAERRPAVPTAAADGWGLYEPDLPSDGLGPLGLAAPLCGPGASGPVSLGAPVPVADGFAVWAAVGAARMGRFSGSTPAEALGAATAALRTEVAPSPGGVLARVCELAPWLLTWR